MNLLLLSLLLGVALIDVAQAEKREAAEKYCVWRCVGSGCFNDCSFPHKRETVGSLCTVGDCTDKGPDGGRKKRNTVCINGLRCRVGIASVDGCRYDPTCPQKICSCEEGVCQSCIDQDYGSRTVKKCKPVSSCKRGKREAVRTLCAWGNCERPWENRVKRDLSGCYKGQRCDGFGCHFAPGCPRRRNNREAVEELQTTGICFYDNPEDPQRCDLLATRRINCKSDPKCKRGKREAVGSLCTVGDCSDKGMGGGRKKRNTVCRDGLRCHVAFKFCRPDPTCPQKRNNREAASHCQRRCDRTGCYDDCSFPHKREASGFARVKRERCSCKEGVCKSCRDEHRGSLTREICQQVPSCP